MTDAQIEKRIADLLAAEQSQPLEWLWLSFSDEDGWRGGCYVEARGMIGAIRWTHRMGITPGGQVKAVAVPEGGLPGPEWRNRLLKQADLDVIDGKAEA